MPTHKQNPVIWITWEKQLRNRSLSNAIGAKLYELTSVKSRWLRYPHLLYKTAILFITTKSKTVVTQNPSLILALFANIFGRIVGKRVIIDSHNGGLFPLERKSIVLNCIAKLVLYTSAFTIVTNKVLARYVQKFGSKPIVVPDPLPGWDASSNIVSGQKNIVFICTWANDEPYLEVIEAGYQLPEDIHVYITGNYKKKLGKLSVKLPKNITLCGFLSDEDYIDLLNSADAIMDLTTRKHCLVCGAYEGTALEKPLILSDTTALRDYFYKGALFTDNSPDDIANKLLMIFEMHDELAEGINFLKASIEISWQKRKKDLMSAII